MPQHDVLEMRVEVVEQPRSGFIGEAPYRQGRIRALQSAAPQEVQIVGERPRGPGGSGQS